LEGRGEEMTSFSQRAMAACVGISREFDGGARRGDAFVSSLNWSACHTHRERDRHRQTDRQSVGRCEEDDEWTLIGRLSHASMQPSHKTSFIYVQHRARERSFGLALTRYVTRQLEEPPPMTDWQNRNTLHHTRHMHRPRTRLLVTPWHNEGKIIVEFLRFLCCFKNTHLYFAII